MGCRSESELIETSVSNQKNTINIGGRISSRLVPASEVKRNTLVWDQVLSSMNLVVNKMSTESNQYPLNDILYREISDRKNNITTYTLPIAVYSSKTPYYLVQQIVLSHEKNVQRMQYLKIIPKNRPKDEQDIFKDLTGTIQILNEKLQVVVSSDYQNGKLITGTKLENKSITKDIQVEGIKEMNSGANCLYISLYEVPCTNGGQHGVGESCKPGYMNDAHYAIDVIDACGSREETYTGWGGSGNHSASTGGVATDWLLNELKNSSNFTHWNYLVEPNKNILLNSVRKWMREKPISQSTIQDLDRRLKVFSDKERMFNDLDVYNQNTSKVANAELAEYSVRVSQMFDYLLENPSEANNLAAENSVWVLDKNRFISWESYLPVFRALGDFMRANPGVEWEEIRELLELHNIRDIVLLKSVLEDWKRPDLVKPTIAFKEHKKLNCIYNKIKKTANFKQYLKNFDSDFSTEHLIFDVGILKDGVNASTRSPHNREIKITFNINQLDRPTADIARTFIHEMIHAEIYRKLLTVASTSGGRIDWKNLEKMLENSDFPGLLDYYMRYKYKSPQHDMMAAHYRGIIKNFVRQVDASITNEQAEAMAWIGLEETITWKNLPQAKKDKIKNTYRHWYKTASKNCP